MMCTTLLHGGVCHRQSTPHKSGNKMKEKKKTKYDNKVSETSNKCCLSITNSSNPYIIIWHNTVYLE